MDYPLVIGVIVALVVCFFAYQWMSKRPVLVRPPQALRAPPTVVQAPIVEQPKEEKYPDIDGQTQAEALRKEPIQRREPSSNQQPAMNSGEAPAQFDQHLRHPEQLFSQGGPPPTMQVTDVPSGRASNTAPAGPGQQGFAPEMAQNGGAFMGNSVFAFDGMEPTGFTSF